MSWNVYRTCVIQIYCCSYSKFTSGIFGLSRHIPYLHILHLLNLSRSTPTMIINVTNIAMETLPFGDDLLIEDPGRNLAFLGSLRRGSCGESHWGTIWSTEEPFPRQPETWSNGVNVYIDVGNYGKPPWFFQGKWSTTFYNYWIFHGISWITYHWNEASRVNMS